MTPQDYWNAIYEIKGDHDVSWSEALPAVSLQLIESAGITPETCVVDVGGGRSRLVDALLAKGLDCLAVLDVSGEALSHTRSRIGTASQQVKWIEADVTAAWTLKPMDIWHDRAVFHFLTAPEHRAGYLGHLRATLKAGGSAIIATFAPDGPDRCSGLPVVRYSPESLAAELGPDYSLQEAQLHRHLTPWGVAQSFQYSRFRRLH
jgi:trans-aconitate methyltransferase